MAREAARGRRGRAARWILLALAACPSEIAVAQEIDAVEGIEALRAGIRTLSREAEALDGSGRAEDAAGARERIRALLAEIEARAGERRLERMEIAMDALRDGGRGDAAEVMRHAIRARALFLEGRDDEEARRIRGRAPNEAEQADLLRFAARILEELNQPEKAASVGGLAEEMRRGEDRPAAESARGVRAGDFREASARREREARLEAAIARLDRLEARVGRLERAIEGLLAAMPAPAGSTKP